MKKRNLYLYLGIVGAMVPVIESCHTNYLAYEEEKDGIYVSTEAGIALSRLWFESWEASDTKASQCNFYVLGFPSSIDREIRYEIVDSLTTAIEGQDYRLETTWVMPAHVVKTNLPVVVWNRRQEDDTRPDVLSVGLKLIENDDFKPVQGYVIQFIYEKTIPSQPSFWNKNILGPWSAGLMWRFLDQYYILKDTHPEIYAQIHPYAGDHFDGYWPIAVEYLVIKYIVAPVYDYYQDHPEPGVVMIPEPRYN